MSIIVLRTGVADTIQDGGRFGYQHLGINPSGAMDLNAMKIVNALVGNQLNDAVIEMSFPASAFQFTKPAIIALGGGDFSAMLNEEDVPLHRSLVVPAGSQLKFSKLLKGAWGYLAVAGGFSLPAWLGSNSTNLKAKAGGVDGRSLKKQDEIGFRQIPIKTNKALVSSWSVNISEFYFKEGLIRCIQGHEFEWLTKQSQSDFQEKKFALSAQCDRMGYRLKGNLLTQRKKQELLSTAVNFGTIQLLPNGELIILMADHQTTGGYPRVAHVITADRSTLAQMRPNEKISFQFITLEQAEELAIKQTQSLQQLQAACKYNLAELVRKIAI